MKTPEQLVENAKQNIEQISVEQAAKICADHKIIDVREADEYAQGHLADAMNIPRGVLEFKIADNIADKNTPIMVYCKTGGRAALSAQVLGELGYCHVKSIEGGYEAWEQAGKPTQTPSETEFY